MSETKLDPRDRLAVMVSMAGSYIESGRGDDALAVMRTVAEDVATEIARLLRELEEARERLEQYQRLVVLADSVARARGDACGLCDALGRDDQPYQSHRAADLIAEAERALTARTTTTEGER